MKKPYLKPKLFSVMKTYNKGQLLKDVIAGIIVAIIALPLSIALALASAEAVAAAMVQSALPQTAANPFDAGYEYMYDCVKDKKSLVFSNSREETEYLCATLRQIAAARGEQDVFLIHHGNLSASIREEAEAKEAESRAKAEREEAAKNVFPQHLIIYNRLRKSRRPTVVPLHDGVCGGCHLTQPPAVTHLVHRMNFVPAGDKRASLVTCQMCGCLLYGD